MKITLPPCIHHKVLTYRVVTVNRKPHTQRGLCESCFVRVVKFTGEPKWTEDKPAGGAPCSHKSRQEIPSKLTANKPYSNTICNRCGAGIREFGDDWSPLREYRFIIEEHP